MSKSVDNYTWNDLRKMVQQIETLDTKMRSFNIVLFGAGSVGQYAYERLEKEYNIIAFSDNNSKSWGGKNKGIPVISPEELKNIENIFVILTVNEPHCSLIKKQMEKMKIPYITYMEYIIRKNFDKFEIVYHQLLKDEFSKKTYIAVLLSYLKNDASFLKEVFVRNQYFEIVEFNMPSFEEIFVDCGAYIGDTMENFVNIRCAVFGKIYSFEPNEKLYKALSVRRERLIKECSLEEEKIIIEKKAVGQEENVVNFTNKQNGTDKVIQNKEQKGNLVEMISLDEYFKHKKYPTFIKADIEGGEMNLIEGAKGIIIKQKPLIVISIYHKIEDLYEIPIKLKQLNSEYKMAIRQHMPLYSETVLYCY